MIEVRETVWNSYRRAMKVVDKSGDHDQVRAVWYAFETYCDTNGWPDWWSDLERAYNDSLWESVYN